MLTLAEAPAGMVSVWRWVSMILPETGSNISTVVTTVCSLSELFITADCTHALSPLRRKRGRLGCTIIGFDDIISFANEATRSSSEYARARNCHVVLALGAVNEKLRLPSAPVVSIGRKKASGVSGARYSNVSSLPVSADSPPSASAGSSSVTSADSSAEPVRTTLCSASKAPEALEVS